MKCTPVSGNISQPLARNFEEEALLCPKEELEGKQRKLCLLFSDDQSGAAGREGCEHEAAAGHGMRTPGLWEHILGFAWICSPLSSPQACGQTGGQELLLSLRLGFSCDQRPGDFLLQDLVVEFGFGAGDRAGGVCGSALTGHPQANPSDTNPRQLFPPSRSGLVLKEE